ncbi:hypothetical protein SAMD00019534_043110 [Acytostelium subglobosum LB1]|uniref:hypothetical protein n=1 Tax=Acytostelium subglobosum LB1 TaxID=1410327 RepID=UPI000644EE6F|nr:hypothetical protein SAMD00019534_043110 [Acytostelium subglobosum LB1]GAM21136.1 hypothetical protein SAMD00019534_043110 [Acytostelium subglobosum LB1]|eukprot:XP_012756270.1 hypothetical protein SAMD00019534_043110 [Acytostelium subglobosum LB1]
MINNNNNNNNISIGSKRTVLPQDDTTNAQGTGSVVGVSVATTKLLFQNKLNNANGGGGTGSPTVSPSSSSLHVGDTTTTTPTISSKSSLGINRQGQVTPTQQHVSPSSSSLNQTKVVQQQPQQQPQQQQEYSRVAPQSNRSKTLIHSHVAPTAPTAPTSAPTTTTTTTGVKPNIPRVMGGLQIGGRTNNKIDEPPPLADMTDDQFEKINLFDDKSKLLLVDVDDEEPSCAVIKQTPWSGQKTSTTTMSKPHAGSNDAFGPRGRTLGKPSAIVIGGHHDEDNKTGNSAGLKPYSFNPGPAQRPKPQYHTIDTANIPQWQRNNADLLESYDHKHGGLQIGNNANNNNLTKVPTPAPAPTPAPTTSEGGVGGLRSNLTSKFSSIVNKATTAVSQSTSSTSSPSSSSSGTGMTRAEAEYADYLQRSKQDTFKDIASLNFIYRAGKDNLGRSVIVVIVSNLPAKQTDMDRVLLYTISVMDPIVDDDYVLVYVHTNMSNDNKPSFAWLKKVYTIFNRKYKKNLKGFSKFWKKLTYIDDLSDLFKYFSREQLNLPSSVMSYRPAGRKSPPYFGVPLQELLNRPDNTHDVPILFIKGIDYLERRGLQAEGLFRLSGANSQVKSLKLCFDSGEDVNLDDCEDVHTVASLLKMFLRELPEPLFPYSTYPSFIEVVKVNRPLDKKIESLKLLMSLLPVANKALTRYLFKFLDKVIKNSNINKMSPANLSIVLAPNLLKSQDTNVMNVVNDTQNVNQVVQLILEHINEIF